MKRLRPVGRLSCLLALFAVILIAPISGLITLAIPDNNTDTTVWTAERDTTGTRLTDDPLLIALLSTDYVTRASEVVISDVFLGTYSPSSHLSNKFTSIRAPPMA